MSQNILDTLGRLINSEASMTPEPQGVIRMQNLLKEASIETIKGLPDECTAEDIMYEVNFIAQVLEGLKDAEAGRLVTTDELLSRVGQWAK
jgi:predicted transcriptional regulator